MITEKEEAKELLSIYRMMQMNGTLYLKEDEQSLDTLFDAVIQAITTATVLKPKLPYNEFVLPSRKVLEGDQGWIGHFEERDNRRFFLSDIYDYLYLLYGRS
ncbi:hypothetical protein [Sulfurovum mangrovi]|uniref:hypothetical protein n=1 Tax=Sulfurovum mangrovi TaxID=2893889 RepID=UPI001E5F6707|nr:hypothetical protein [Sulfurovum mangrovi]UFH58368.1 hypothetical protein LN246_08400 [Sulfurovum mangrovi]